MSYAYDPCIKPSWFIRGDVPPLLRCAARSAGSLEQSLRYEGARRRVPRRHHVRRLCGQSAFAAATAINLGSATPYAVVAGTTITNTGSSVITGNIGLSPGTSITGFPPGLVAGTTGAADATSLAAQTSATAAYGVAAGATPFTTVAGGNIGGTTLSPGVYEAASAMQLTGPVTLNAGGDASAVFIFQAGSTLTTASGASVVLEGGAQACNVFWQVGSSATLGSTTSFVGTILALASVTLNSGATVDGRLLAQTGAVTLNDNIITVPTCARLHRIDHHDRGHTRRRSHVGAVTTTTKPAGTAHPVTKKGAKGKRRRPRRQARRSRSFPVGAPATGEGGTAGSGFSPLGLIGLGAITIAAERRRSHFASAVAVNTAMTNETRTDGARVRRRQWLWWSIAGVALAVAVVALLGTLPTRTPTWWCCRTLCRCRNSRRARGWAPLLDHGRSH